MRQAPSPALRPARQPWRRPERRLSTGGGPVGSVTFPATRLQFRVMIALGADLTASWLTWQWEDITRFVRYDVGISTRTGRPDQSTVVTPGRTVLKLDNRDGRFSRRNPTGPYYGLLSKNTPLWVQVDAGSGYRTRVQHYVNEWPTRWDKSGNDCTVTIVASGVLRRMTHSSALASPLRRAILSGDTPTAYWPFEDGSDATRVGSGLFAGAPLVLTSGTLALGTGVSVPGSLTSACDLGTGTAKLTGPIPTVSATSWQLDAVLGSDSLTASSDAPQVQIDTPTGVITRWGIETFTSSGENHWSLYYFDSNTGVLNSFVGSSNLRDGLAHHVRITATQSGANIALELYVDGVLESSGSATSRTLTMPSTAEINPLSVTGNDILDVCHVEFWAPTASVDVAPAVDGYAGEMAHERIERMCSVAGVTYASTGATARSQQLGPQPINTALQIIRDAESVDHGVVFEADFGLGYQGKQQRYNAPVLLALDFDQGHIAEAPQPADDDQGTANRVAVSRTDGSEAIVEDSASVAAEGLYDDSETANTYTDEQLVNIAGWHVHEGTIDEDRWPSLALNFLRNPGLIDTWAALPYGARLSADNPPPEVAPDPIDAFIEGHTEWCTPLDWRATVNTSPATVYEVYQVEADGNRGRVDTAGSSLVTAVDETATSLSVASTGTIWVQGTVNFDLFIAGERMTVTNITGAASPQTFTVTRSVNGVAKTQSAGAVVRLWRPGAVAL